MRIALLLAIGFYTFVGSSCPMQQAAAMEMDDQGLMMSHEDAPVCPVQQDAHKTTDVATHCDGGHCMGMRADTDDALTNGLIMDVPVADMPPAQIERTMDCLIGIHPLIVSHHPPGENMQTVVLRC